MQIQFILVNEDFETKIQHIFFGTNRLLVWVLPVLTEFQNNSERNTKNEENKLKFMHV